MNYDEAVDTAYQTIRGLSDELLRTEHDLAVAVAEATTARAERDALSARLQAVRDARREIQGERERLQFSADAWPDGKPDPAAEYASGGLDGLRRALGWLDRALDAPLGTPGDEKPPQCAFNVGTPEVCRCMLPTGHAGMHQCEHTAPKPQPRERGYGGDWQEVREQLSGMPRCSPVESSGSAE